jgi:hypothetical protein
MYLSHTGDVASEADLPRLHTCIHLNPSCLVIHAQFGQAMSSKEVSLNDEGDLQRDVRRAPEHLDLQSTSTSKEPRPPKHAKRPISPSFSPPHGLRIWSSFARPLTYSIRPPFFTVPANVRPGPAKVCRQSALPDGGVPSHQKNTFTEAKVSLSSALVDLRVFGRAIVRPVLSSLLL